MSANLKYRVIYRFRDKYNVTDMCGFFHVSRSGYYAWKKRTDRSDPDEENGKLIAACQEKTRQTYGYRRVQIWLLREHGLVLNHKTVLRLMKKYNLLAKIRRNRHIAKYTESIHKYENLWHRDFSTTTSNQKWCTDISYIPTKQGFVFLSMIKDLHDNFIVAYKIGDENNNDLVFETIKRAKREVATELQLHSDQGFQYTSQGYLNLTQEYHITPSMSRPGTPIDNACAENFFSTLKSEWLRHVKPATKEEARLLLEEYIHFYNYERIQLKTKLTPFEMRCQSCAI